MSATSRWAWTLVISSDGRQYTLPGETIAAANATADTILPPILKDVPRQFWGRDGGFRVISFSATRTN
ncbi:hypothetical protein [Streptomyces acidicola]|uniref:Uncharacterized protein n=1 Tax=Streptomyces acidicola TaxID=2596892 RepID=A0A5N8WKA3_9ACTN|nr:hypothetical protein [Streptomyces acidicola]MPY47127.1 hypothetical protein [Streptomyces acidicola]MPY47266.1 hypothetical protein [Streptomyces acidicola]